MTAEQAGGACRRAASARPARQQGLERLSGARRHELPGWYKNYRCAGAGARAPACADTLCLSPACLRGGRALSALRGVAAQGPGEAGGACAAMRMSGVRGWGGAGWRSMPSPGMVVCALPCSLDGSRALDVCERSSCVVWRASKDPCMGAFVMAGRAMHDAMMLLARAGDWTRAWCCDSDCYQRLLIMHSRMHSTQPVLACPLPPLLDMR